MDAFLLARHCNPGSSPAGGRAWQMAVSQLLSRPGIHRQQPAGILGLFGRNSRSGVNHEIDGAGRGLGIVTLIESKARITLDKPDIAVFHTKCFDFYQQAALEYPEETAGENWWPLLVSSHPTGKTVRQMCCDLGVVLCDPERLPLPTLLYAASRPNADDYLDEVRLREFVRLAEPVCVPMQEQWRFDADRREFRLSLDRISADEIEDLLFLQDELSESILDALELNEPGLLEVRAAPLVERFEAARLASN